MNELGKDFKIIIKDKAIERATRLHNWIMLILPASGVIFGVVFASQWGVQSWEIVLFITMWALLMIGNEVGVHRYFAHKSFTVKRPIRNLLAILGSMAGQGPIVYWVANHRCHHTYSDHEHDPHSPYFYDHKKHKRGLRGLWHAHIGWLFDHETPNTTHFARDMLRDSWLFKINQYYYLWVFLALALPCLIGFLCTLHWSGALRGVVWGGLIPIFLAQQAMFCINSFTHYFGTRPFETNDQSRNTFWLAIPTIGQAWHNNHHAFPSSAVTGFHWWQVDLGGIFIRLLKVCGLAEEVNIPTKEKLNAKLKGEVFSVISGSNSA